MAQLLDARTSQNASFANSISEEILAVDTPELVGQVGLNIFNPTGIIRVQFTGTVAVEVPILPVVTAITVTVVRGTLPTDDLVYSAEQNLELSVLAPQIITFTGSDLDVPAPASNHLVYTMFISSDTIGTTRVGPESFNAAAYSD
jgi:hypothetical protein